MGDMAMGIMMTNKIPEGGGLTAPVSFDTGIANEAMVSLKDKLNQIAVSSFDGKEKLVDVKDAAFKQFENCGKNVDFTVC